MSGLSAKSMWGRLQGMPRTRRVVVYVVLILVSRRLFRAARNAVTDKYTTISRTWVDGVRVDPRPIVAFGGAGCLWAYYVGVMCYLQENFVLGNVRFSGISMGAMPASAMALGLSSIQVFKMGLAWSSMISKRRMKCLWMRPEEFVDSGLQTCAKFGVTDQHVQALQGSGRLLTGATDLSVLPFQHVIMTDPTSLAEALRLATISMRVFPFFRSPECVHGMVLGDGAFSANFTVPDNACKDKLIKVSPFFLCFGATVRPRSGHGPPLKNVFASRSRVALVRQVRMGYMDCMRSHHLLVDKGLQVRNDARVTGRASEAEIRRKSSAAVAAFDRLCSDHSRERQLSRDSSFNVGYSSCHSLEQLLDEHERK